jgi:hypothetical protein
MPRKDSKATRIKIVARWLEWPCSRKWQHNIAAELGYPVTWISDDHENLTDSFTRPEGAANQEEIEAKIKQLPADELERLAAAADRQSNLFRDGRPWSAWNYLLVEDVDALLPRLRTVRAACHHLVNTSKKKYGERYKGRSADALRTSYYETKSIS